MELLERMELVWVWNCINSIIGAEQVHSLVFWPQFPHQFKEANTDHPQPLLALNDIL